MKNNFERQLPSLLWALHISLSLCYWPEEKNMALNAQLLMTLCIEHLRHSQLWYHNNDTSQSLWVGVCPSPSSGTITMQFERRQQRYPEKNTSSALFSSSLQKKHAWQLSRSAASCRTVGTEGTEVSPSPLAEPGVQKLCMASPSCAFAKTFFKGIYIWSASQTRLGCHSSIMHELAVMGTHSQCVGNKMLSCCDKVGPSRLSGGCHSSTNCI